MLETVRERRGQRERRERGREREREGEREGERERGRALTLQLSKAIHWDFGSSRDKLQQPRPHLIIIILHSLQSGEREGDGMLKPGLPNPLPH